MKRRQKSSSQWPQWPPRRRFNARKQAEIHPDPFTREGLLLIVDGTDPEQVRQILELEMDAKELKHESYAKIFEAAGGYAPTMGIIGTVMGLIRVLGNLTDPSNLGTSSQ